MLFFRLGLFVLFAVLWGTPPTVASQQPIPTAEAVPRQEKALRYHSVLRRRPSPGYLFDRFFNTWLDTSSLDELEKFLASEVARSGSTNDRLMLAFFYAKQGEDVRALEQFRTALEKDPGNAETLYEKAVIEGRTLDFENALSDLNKAAAADPQPETSIKIAQLQGKLLVRNRQNEEAIKVWSELVKKNATDEILIEDIIELQISEGLYDEANELSDTLIKITKDPYQKVVRRLRKGDIYQRSGKKKKAIEVYGQSLGQVGMDSWLEREIIGQIEQLFRREDDVIGLKEHYESLIKSDGKRMAIRKASSKILFELGMVDESLKTFEEIVKLTPGDRTNRESFIDLLARADRLETAIKHTETMIEQFPKDAELRTKLAQLYHKNNSKDGASKAIDAFLSVSGNNEYAFLRAARLLEKFDNPEKASSVYSGCIEAFPESDSAKESYASFLFKQDKKQEAIAIWKQLADGADRSQLVRISRIVSSRQEHKVAYEMLFARFNDFKLDTIFLGQLCNEAIAEKKFVEALPWVQSRVRLAKTSADLDACLGQAVQVISKSGELEIVVEKIKSDATRSTPSTCLLAELMDRNNQSESAEQLLNESLDAIQKNASAKEDVQMFAQQIVRMYVNRQDWSAAAKSAEEMVGLPGGRKSVNLRQLVNLCFRAGELPSALKWAGEWKKVSPGSLIPWLEESKIYDRMGRYKDAINVLRIATQKFPNDPDLFARLGQRYVENGQFRDAERIYWQQYEESEKLADKLQWSERLASLSDSIGSLDELISKFEERRKNNPKSVEPLLALAQVHRVADNYEERRQALLEATRIQKDSLPLMMEIARLEESEGDWQKAIQTLEKASKVDKSTRAKQQIARIYIQYGESKEGFLRLLDVAGGKNSSARDVESIADAIIATGDWEQARDFLLPQVARFENDYRLKFQLAVASEELDLIDEAEEIFVSLLNVQNELTGLQTNSNSMHSYYQQQIDMIQNVLPPVAAEIYQLEMAKQSVYQYRNRRRAMARFGGPFAMGMGYLPDNVSTCRTYAIAHLMELIQDLNEGQQQDLKDQMRSAGVSHVDLMMNPDIESFSSGVSLMDVVDANPDDHVALALCVFGLVGEEESDSKYGVLGYKAFKGKYSVLAFVSALQAAAIDKKHASILDQAIGEIDKNEPPNEILVSSIARYVAGRSMGNEMEHQFTPELVSKLNGILMESYPKLKNNQGMSQWMFGFIAVALKKEAAADRIIEFMDDEIARSKTRQAQASNMYSPFSYYGGQDNELAVLPVFPPQQLVSFPPNVLGLLSLSNNEDSYEPFSSDDEDPEELIEKYKEGIPKAKDPMLKILLEIKVAQGDPEEEVKENKDRMLQAKASLESLLKSQPPNIDAFYLAGCLATGEQRWTDAADYFEKMRNLPMSREMRKKIDGHLVALAIQGVVTRLDSKENEAVLNSAKAAALRLRRIRMAPEQRTNLVSVFETLGLKEEAEKMESKLAQRGNLFSNLFSGGRRAPMAAPRERVKELADTGKMDAAARLVVQEFRAFSQAELDIDSMFENEYEIQELGRKIKSLGLMEEFLKQVHPGESKISSRISTHGLAEELFGDKKKAKDIYLQALKDNEKLDAVRLRLMILELPTRPDAFRFHFEKFQQRSKPKVGTGLIRSLHQDTLKFQDGLNVIEQISAYLDTIDKESEHDLSFVASAVDWLSGSHQIDKRSAGFLGSIYTKKNEQENKPREKKETKKQQEKREQVDGLTKRRDLLHDQLARKLIEFPSVAADGFTALLASAEARGDEVGEEFVKLATDALRPDKKKKSATRRSAMMQSMSSSYYGGYSDDEDSVVQRSPDEFLARHFGLSTSEDDARVDTIAKQLEQWKVDDKAKSLRQIYKLYSVLPEAFTTEATKYLEDANRLKKRQPDAVELAIAKIVEVWADRNGPADIESLLLEQLREQNKSSRGSSYWYSSSTYLSDYLVKLTQKSGSEPAQKFLDQYCELLLGTEEEQKKLVEQIGDRRNRSNSKQVRNYQQYMEFLQMEVSNPELIFMVVEEASRLGMNEILQQAEYQLSDFVQTHSLENAEKGLRWFSNSNLLKDVDEFDPIFNTSSPSSPTLWGQAVIQMGMRGREDDEIEDSFADYLANKKDLNFGESILHLALEEKIRKPAMLELFEKHLDKIKSLPEEKQDKLCVFANQVIKNIQRYDRRAVGVTSEKGKRAETFINSRMGASVNSDAQKLLSAKKLSDLGVEDHELDDWATAVISQMDRSDPNKIIEAMTKVSDWMTKSSSGSVSYYSENFHSNLLESLFTFDKSVESIQVLLNVLSNEKSKRFVYSDDSVYEFVLADVKSKRAKLAKETGRKKSAIAFAEAIDAFHREMGERIGDLDTTLLIPVYQKVVYELELDESEFDKVAKWAAMESKSGKYKNLAHAWDLALRSGSAIIDRWNVQKNATEDQPAPELERLSELSEGQRALLELVTDENRTIAWRLPIAAWLITQDQALAPSGVWACSEFIAKAMDEKFTVDGDTIRWTMSSMLDCKENAKFIENATRLGKSWRAKKFVQTNPNRYYGYSRDSEELNFAIELFAEIDQPTVVSQITKRFGDQLKTRSALAKLITCGFHQQARPLCISLWSEPNRRNQNYEPSKTYYTKELHEALPEMIKLFGDESTKLLAETFFASFEDPKDKKKAASIDRNKRLLALAARYPKVKFASRSQNDLVLVLLSTVKESAEHIAEPLENACASINVSQLWDENNSGDFTLRRSLLASHVAMQVRIGNFAPLTTLLDQLKQIDHEDDSWSFEQMVSEFEELISPAISELMFEANNDAQFEKLLPILAQMGDPMGEVRICSELNVLAHVIAGKSNELVMKYVQASEADEEDRWNRTDLDEMWLDVAKLLKSQNELEDVEKRIQVVKDIWALGSKAKFSIGSGHFQDGIQESCSGCRDGRFGLEAVVDAKLLSPEELTEVGPQLAEIDSVHGEIWRQVAKQQVKQKQLELAAVSYKNALDGGTDKMKQAKFNRSVEYANVLSELGRDEQAKKLLVDIDSGQLLGDNVETYDVLRAKFDEK